MCQLLALNSNTPAAITFAFTGFSARGGATGEHVDGFGLAFHQDSGCRLFVDEGRASDAALAHYLRRTPIRARTTLAHIRKATQGDVTLRNCHPFLRTWQGRQWSFCHNGDLRDFHPLLHGPDQPHGDTDSERALGLILQTLRQRFDDGPTAGWREIAPVLAELAGRIAAHGTFNFLLSDGHALYAHASNRLSFVQRQYPFSVARLVDADMSFDLASVNGRSDRMVLIATEPLTHDEPWQTFGPGELRVFVSGEEAWRSPTAL